MADPSTATGLRLRFDADMPSVVGRVPESFLATHTALSTLDGFGTLAGITLSFTGPVDLGTVPSGEGTEAAGGPVAVMCDAGDGSPARFPFEVQPTDEDRTQIQEPMVPLPPATRCSRR